MSENLRVGLGGVYPNDRKVYSPIFASSSKSMNVSLSIQAEFEYTRNVGMTLIYWDNGEKKVIRDFLSGMNQTVLEFTIEKPTAVPPYILYFDSTGVGVADISVESDTKLIQGVITEYDEDLLQNTIELPIFSLDELYQLNDLIDQSTLEKVKIHFETAEVTKSPLVVDLDGDGVETVGVSEGVYFDHDGNGFAEKSGWVGKDDGILVRDINNNGTIDNGTELFGNNSVLSSGENALNGFEALKELDSNRDGVFNSSDEAWNTVKVWKDSNQNGIVDNSELLSLEQANIAGINLNYNEQELVDGNGNTHAQTGTIIKTDGSSGTITDVWFDADTADTIDQAEVIIPDDIKSLPDVSGFGNVHSLLPVFKLHFS